MRIPTAGNKRRRRRHFSFDIIYKRDMKFFNSSPLFARAKRRGQHHSDDGVYIFAIKSQLSVSAADAQEFPSAAQERAEDRCVFWKIQSHNACIVFETNQGTFFLYAHGILVSRVVGNCFYGSRI
jgi:hypothetical protein